MFSGRMSQRLTDSGRVTLSPHRGVHGRGYRRAYGYQLRGGIRDKRRGSADDLLRYP